jgi:hypothetical protein
MATDNSNNSMGMKIIYFEGTQPSADTGKASNYGSNHHHFISSHTSAASKQHAQLPQRSPTLLVSMDLQTALEMTEVSTAVA